MMGSTSNISRVPIAASKPEALIQSEAFIEIDIRLQRFLSCESSKLIGAALPEGFSGQSSQFLRV